MNKAAIVALFSTHDCEQCAKSVTVLKQYVMFGGQPEAKKQGFADRDHYITQFLWHFT